MVGEGAGVDAAASCAVRDRQCWAERDRVGVVVDAVAGHGILGAIEDGERVWVGCCGGEVPVGEWAVVAAGLLEVVLV